MCTWNIKDFGQSKSDEEIKIIVSIVKGYDLLAVQEVVAGPSGAKAVARFADALNRCGAKWDYVVSNVTSGEPNSRSSERYAFFWKPSKLKKVGDAWLEKKYHVQIDREPYMATFSIGAKNFTVATMHAVPKSKLPETELKYLKELPLEYPGKKLIFCGDFNLSQSHSVFTPLKNLGYKPCITKQKTSLKRACKENDCLASEYDNIFYDSKQFKPLQAGVIHFYKKFATLKEAQAVSDHIPVFFSFSMN